MNIALVGYGKMGRQIEELARDRKIHVARIFASGDNRNGSGLSKESLKDVDVCIEFTSPSSVVDNILSIAEAGKNVVVGTTGWYDRLPEVTSIVREKEIGLVYAPNFSLGVNLFYQIVAEAARLFDKFDPYDVAVSETHHREKADSPSGTALAIADLIIRNMRRKKEILHETAHATLKPEQLHVASSRIGSVIGRHSVLFDSDADCVEIVHEAKNRRGFALGSLIAAEWVKGRKGIFTMNDVLTS